MRIELASALRRDIPVVPVLVRGAKMPSAEDLPDDLKELAYRNAVELTHARWKSDVQVLIQALRPYMEEQGCDSSAQDGDGVRGAREAIAEAARETAGNLAAAVGTIDAQTMERVSKALAAYIGPIAEVVVKRAAKRCSSPEDFYDKVASEIESDAERARFLKMCRS